MRIFRLLFIKEISLGGKRVTASLVGHGNLASWMFSFFGALSALSMVDTFLPNCLHGMMEHNNITMRTTAKSSIARV